MVKAIKEEITHSHGYKLIDGEERSAKHPDTFEVPDKEERANVPVGAWAKVGFEYDGKSPKGSLSGERMWVRVTGRNGDAYLGTLDNDPVELENIKYGDMVEFQPKHVLSIMGNE